MNQKKMDKIVVIATKGIENPDMATMPFVLLNTALAMDTEAVAVLQGAAVVLAKKGCYEHVFAPGLQPLKKLVDTFLELGGVLLVCEPCVEERKISKDMLVEGAELIKSGRVVIEVLEARATLNY